MSDLHSLYPMADKASGILMIHTKTVRDSRVQVCREDAKGNDGMEVESS